MEHSNVPESMPIIIIIQLLEHAVLANGRGIVAVSFCNTTMWYKQIRNRRTNAPVWHRR